MLNETNQTSSSIAEIPPYFFIIIGILLSGMCIQLFNSIRSRSEEYPSEQFLKSYFIIGTILFSCSSAIAFFNLWLFKNPIIFFYIVESLLAGGFFALFIAFILFTYHQIRKQILGDLLVQR